MRSTAPILILDGGLGTTLETQHGVVFSSATTPLWSSHLLVTDQRTLLACQAAFAAAGADIISTATYQLSVAGLARTRTAEWPRGISVADAGRFIEDAMLVASEAAGASGRVALSLGPYGATMLPASAEYSGAYDEAHVGVDVLRSWHLDRLMMFAKSETHLLSGGSVSYIAFETMPRLDEIIAVRQAVAEVVEVLPRDHYGSGGVPFWISCVFPGDGETLPDGTTLEETVQSMLSSQISSVVPYGIGINCTKINKLPSLVQRYEEVVRGMVDAGEVDAWPALILYPDGTNGEVYNTTTQKWESTANSTPSDVSVTLPERSWENQLAEVVKTTQRRGGWEQIIVGGCCKTMPENIRSLRSALNKRPIRFDEAVSDSRRTTSLIAEDMKR